MFSLPALLLDRAERRPQLFAILNITPDSFSDGGRYLESKAALQHAHCLMQEGADCLEIGAASSHPKAPKIRPEQEIARLQGLLPLLAKEDWPLSLDSCQTEVQRYVLRYLRRKKRALAYLNDTSAFADPSMYSELAEIDSKLILMHSIYHSGQRQGPISEQNSPPDRGELRKLYEGIVAFFEKRLSSLEKSSIAAKRLILDPGMGFFLGSHPDYSIFMIQNLKALKQDFGLPIMLSVSRKSFIGNLSRRPVQQRSSATLATELLSCLLGEVDCIRTHEVAPFCDAWNMLTALAAKL